MRWAFSDESCRSGKLVVAAAIVETHDVNASRSVLRAFLRPNQRRIHMAKEGRARRQQFASLIVGLPIECVAVVTGVGRRGMPAAREVALDALAGVLIDRGVESWTLEAIGHVQEGRDRRSIARRVARSGHRGEFVYDHRPPHSEPLLWAADGLAWLTLERRVDEIERIDIP